MYKVACAVCGKISFTAVRVQWLTSPFCPYCGGNLKQNEIQDKNALSEKVRTLSTNPS